MDHLNGEKDLASQASITHNVVEVVKQDGTTSSGRLEYEDSYSRASVMHHRFPERSKEDPAARLRWYDGGILTERPYERVQPPEENDSTHSGLARQYWIDAIRGNTKTVGDSDYAGSFTETVLLGTLALFFLGRPQAWDGANMKVTNLQEANEYVQHHHRSGWSLQGGAFRARRMSLH